VLIAVVDLKRHPAIEPSISSKNAFESDEKAKPSSKTAFTCPGCGQKALAKPHVMRMCGIEAVPLEIEG
jgi:predicted RNA-binding Zn-ribbon protein involved in translation (DUF1610 family)